MLGEMPMKSMEVLKDLNLKMKLWYGRQDVKYELIKFLKNREFAYIAPKWLRKEYKGRVKDISNRNWRVHNTQHFDVLMNTFIFNSNPRIVNLYNGMAQFTNGLPYQTLDLTKRDNEDWKKNGWKQMCGYDILLDVDADSHRKTVSHAWPSAKVLMGLLDDNKVAYELRFSGMGFHFIIPASALPKMHFDPAGKDSIFSFTINFLAFLRKKVTQILDMTIFDSKKLCKLPYSLAVFKKASYVCTPILSREEFENFKLSDYSFENMMQKSVRGRGTFLFNSEYKDIDNVTGLLKKLGDDVK
jgi:hypothetical protein